MNQKQKRKHGIITKCFSIIFSIILLFTMTTTTFAFDGEIGGPADKTMLESYLPNCDVLYNPLDLPLYSCFNHEVLYWTLKWPANFVNTGLTDEDYISLENEYLAITTEESGLYYTYYVFPAAKDADVGSMNFSQVYKFMTIYDYEINETTKKFKSTNQFKAALSEYTVQTNSGINNYYAHVYCTVRSKENSILSISEIYMGNYGKIFEHLPWTDIVQIYWYSATSSLTSAEIPEEFTYTKNVKTKNLNYLVSTSTYSVTAYDYFDDVENLTGFFSSSNIPFTYDYKSFMQLKTSQLYITIPEAIRGPDCPADGKVSLVPDNTTYPYYLSEGIFNENKSFLMMPLYDYYEVAFRMLFFVFPDDSESLIYFKFSGKGAAYPSSYTTTGCYSTCQVLSKIDYDLYINHIQIGSFDAETTTYTCIKLLTFRSGDCISGVLTEPFLSSKVSFLSNATIKAGESYQCYPWLTLHNSVYGYAFPLSFIYGQKSSFSLFRDSNNMGFYTYVSPDLNENVLGNGNSGDPSAPPSSGGNDDFWGIENLEIPDGDDHILNVGLPPEPDFIDIDKIDFSNILELPNLFIIYLIECIDWFVTSFDLIMSKYMTPVSSFLKIVSLIFAYIPDYLKFLFLFIVLSSLVMKILQYSTASVSTIDSMAKGGD